jgi:hypothetical protein
VRGLCALLGLFLGQHLFFEAGRRIGEHHANFALTAWVQHFHRDMRRRDKRDHRAAADD